MKQTSAHVSVSCMEWVYVIIIIISMKLALSGQRLPQGNATYVYESGSPVQFEVQQPTNPLPPNLIINFCSGSLGITIMSASGQKKTISKMWNMVWCDFESGQAQINLSVDSFPRPTAERNYTVIFNISFHIDGFVDLCYLQVEVDNVTLADQGELYYVHSMSKQHKMLYKIFN